MSKTCKSCAYAHEPEPSIQCAQHGCTFPPTSPACEYFELRQAAEESAEAGGEVCFLADARKRFQVTDGGEESGEAWRARAGELAYAITKIRRAARVGDAPLERLPGAIEVKLATAEQTIADLRYRLAEAERERGKLCTILSQIQGKRSSAAGSPYAHVGITLLDEIDAVLSGKEAAHA